MQYTTARSEKDLRQIVALQSANHRQSLTPEVRESEGFLTVLHTYAELKEFSDIERHIIAKSGDQVIAYVLAMTHHSKFDLPVLIPMFQKFDEITYQGTVISDYRYIVVGQVCVAKAYRGTGVFEACYRTYRNHFQDSYDFAITEIAATNLRSLRAHSKVGFKEIARFTAFDRVEWCMVIWDWRTAKHT